MKYRPKDTPPISIIAKQIENFLITLKLTTAFVATDGTVEGKFRH